MEKEQIERIVQQALERDIEVRLAKRPADAQLEGLHLVEPNYLQLLEGIQAAIWFGTQRVIVHSRQLITHPPKK